MNYLNCEQMIETLWQGLLIIAAVSVVTLLPLEAIANPMTTTVAGGENSAFDRLFCNILSVFTGPVGKGIATIAIVIVGVGALMGKVTWTVAIIVAMGVAIIFGASSIVTSFSDQGAADTGGSAACSTGGIDTVYGTPN